MLRGWWRITSSTTFLLMRKGRSAASAMSSGVISRSGIISWSGRSLSTWRFPLACVGEYGTLILTRPEVNQGNGKLGGPNSRALFRQRKASRDSSQNSHRGQATR